MYGDFYRPTRKDGNISTEDVEKLLEYQVDQMQSTSAFRNAYHDEETDSSCRDGKSASTRHEKSVPEYGRSWSHRTKSFTLHRVNRNCPD